ncbi:MAG: flagellar motor protein MotB [Comamonadaceae bacterium]|nr:flagellar motor protein MotB [Comamonadaceae bacterium]
MHLHLAPSRLLPAAAILATATWMVACAPVSRVILLPQSDGTPSAVVVRTPQSEAVIDVPYAVANVSRSGRVETATTTADEVRSRYPRLLAIESMAPERFMLEFEPGTSDLTQEAQSRLEAVIERAGARPGGEIVVTGHTDRQGTVEANDQLSLRRALAVRALFIGRGFPPERIEAVGRGEREPLVPTEDEVPEPRNRRAEILVR